MKYLFHTCYRNRKFALKAGKTTEDLNEKVEHEIHFLQAIAGHDPKGTS